MMTDYLDIAFLKQLVTVDSPTGWEQPAQRIIRQYTQGFADSVETDVLGNVISILNPSAKPKIMLAGHVDEVGLQIRYINDKGFLYFASLGGVDAHLTPGKRVYVLSGEKRILGIIGKKAIHLQKVKDRTKVIELSDQFIDIGAESKKDAEQMGVRIGDPVVFEGEFEYLGDKGLIVSRCFDDKIGAFIVNEILRHLKSEKPTAAVYAVSTVQEEIGTVGAGTSAFTIAPDVGIAFDVTFASDSPDTKDSEIGPVKLGSGPVVSRGPNINHTLFDLIVNTAKELEIPLQFRAAPRQTGTDARAIYQSRGGVATALIGIPNRYMHSMSEIVHLKDVEMIVKLMVAVIKKISTDLSFIPN
ncbi:MAG: M42 family metallopeptidase [Candidatus Heimdallarchaeota archaeon]|nr:M42 family metallopeptidase [Candidatus Heimdallarchaeota archaeon]